MRRSAARPWLLRLLDMPAELIAHRRQDFDLEFRVAARAEALIQRRREHGNGHALVDARLDGPAAFARIGDTALELLELRIRRQTVCREIKQPGSDDAAAAPDLGHLRQIDVELIILRIPQ